MSGHPQIGIATCDPRWRLRLGSGAGAARAVQVADRWHLMENASQACVATTRSCMRQVRAALGVSTVDPSLLTAAEKLQYDGYLRREDVNDAIMALHSGGNCGISASAARCASSPSGPPAVVERSRSTSKG